MKRRVAIALSGGVDSLVAASLLKQDSYDLFGIHFTTGYETDSGNIEAYGNRLESKDLEKQLESRRSLDIHNLEKQLNIPIFTVDLKDIFRKEVVSYFISTYQRGQTPNPCLICNKKIKFGTLCQAAHDLGADLLATGHYAKTDLTGAETADGYPEVRLFKGVDPDKDQSYFLSMLSCEQLRGAIFPLGDLTKKEVVAIAAEKGLVPTQEKESQDICFISENSFADFISSNCNMPSAPGKIVTTDNRVVGTHRGVHCYTIGQRRGLNCPGPAPYYVKKIDVEKRELTVGFKEELLERECTVRDLNWLCDPNNFLSTSSSSTPSLEIITKIRYSHAGCPSTLICQNDRDRLKVLFDEPQYAITPGQCAVFYHGEQVVGAGIIE